MAAVYKLKPKPEMEKPVHAVKMLREKFSLLRWSL